MCLSKFLRKLKYFFSPFALVLWVEDQIKIVEEAKKQLREIEEVKA